MNSLEVKVAAGRLGICLHGNGGPQPAAWHTLESEDPGEGAGFLRESLERHHPAEIRLRLSPGSYQAVTRNFTELPWRQSERTLFLNVSFEREFGAETASRCVGRHLEWRRGKDGSGAGVWVTDLLAAPGVAAAVLTAARESGCFRLKVELESSLVLCAVPGSIILGLSFEPARVVFGIWRAGRPPYVLRPVALATGGGETGCGEPLPIEPQALIAPGREILARARARGVEPESLVLDEQVVGPRISAAGAGVLAELLALPLRVETGRPGKETPDPGFAFTLKEPPSLGRSCVQALGSAIGRHPRALPVLLVLIALAQVAFLVHVWQATGELTARISRLTQAPIAGAVDGAAGPSDPRVAELHLLSEQRSRSLHALLTEVEPLLPDTVRLTRVGLSREGRLAIAGRAREAEAVNRLFSALQEIAGFRNVFLTREEAVRDSSVKDKAVVTFELAAEIAEASSAREASEGSIKGGEAGPPSGAASAPQLSGGRRGR